MAGRKTCVKRAILSQRFPYWHGLSWHTPGVAWRSPSLRCPTPEGELKEGELKNGSRRRKEADFGTKNTSAS